MMRLYGDVVRQCQCPRGERRSEPTRDSPVIWSCRAHYQSPLTEIKAITRAVSPRDGRLAIPLLPTCDHELKNADQLAPGCSAHPAFPAPFLMGGKFIATRAHSRG